jgi:hypothetical protein
VDDFNCCEVIFASIIDNLAPAIPESIIAISSCFLVGVDSAKYMCDFVNGVVIVIDYLFCRTKEKPQIKKLSKR